MKPKVKVIKKYRYSPCACSCPDCKPDPECKRCNGNGKYRDYYYIMIVGKIAYGMDTIK